MNLRIACPAFHLRFLLGALALAADFLAGKVPMVRPESLFKVY
ncbi:hypothetical protein V9K67_00635 [Paraflavisolibacter sp. H34]